MRRAWLIVPLLNCLLFAEHSEATISFGQMDTFQDGTTMNWHEGGSSPNPPTNIFRLYGDSDGSGKVDSTDFLAFRLAFLNNTMLEVFDYDNSTAVDSFDFLQFRLRFLTLI